jgi:integrase
LALRSISVHCIKDGGFVAWPVAWSPVVSRAGLTELTVRRTKPPTSGYIWLADPVLRSFGIRIYATSRRVWGITRRWDGARHPSFRRIGEFPAMGLVEARAKAGMTLTGGLLVVPLAFSEVVEQFLHHARTRKGRPLRANTSAQYRRMLKLYAAPLSTRRFADIVRRDVAALIRAVAVNRGSTTASLVRAVMSRLWSFAIAEGLVETNVVTGVSTYAVPKRSRILSDIELQQLWAATEPLDVYHVVIRLLLLTGCRRGEIGNLRWSEIGADGVLRIPGSRTKNHRELVLLLPRLALEEIARVPRVVGQDALFGPRGFNNWVRAKHVLDAKLTFVASWVIHDLRRTTESRLAQLGVAKEIRSRVLNHDVGDIELAYQHYDFVPEKRDALALWADELERIVAQPLPRVVRINQECFSNIA